mgnify:CR=1 FL=1
MKHLITVISIVIFIAGLDLVSGLVSSGLTGLNQAFTNSSWNSLFGIGFMVLGIIGVSFVIIRSSYHGLVLDSRECPICESEIKRRRRKINHRIAGKILGKSISGARCNGCGWEGVVYR